LLGKVTLASSQ